MRMAELRPYMRPTPNLPISFPLGRAWFVVFVSAEHMHLARDGSLSNFDGGHDDRPYFPVEQAINALGFETFVPTERRYSIKKNKKVEVVTPLLGSYVFVRFDREADDWGFIKRYDPQRGDGIPGVHFVMRDIFNCPKRVPDHELQKLRDAEEHQVFDFTRPPPPLQTGDEIEFREGPFMGYRDLIMKIRSAPKRKRMKIFFRHAGMIECDPCILAKIG